MPDDDSRQEAERIMREIEEGDEAHEAVMRRLAESRVWGETFGEIARGLEMVLSNGEIDDQSREHLANLSLAASKAHAALIPNRNLAQSPEDLLRDPDDG